MATLQSQFNTTLKNFRALEDARTNPRHVRDLDIEPPYESPALFPEQAPASSHGPVEEDLALEQDSNPEPNAAQDPKQDPKPVNHKEPGPHPSTHGQPLTQPQQNQQATTTNPNPSTTEKPKQTPDKKAA
jgi:hypothetical protein